MARMNHDEPYPEAYLLGILKSVKTIAMVGASPDKTKFSYGVLRVLHETGYDMIPVNPSPGLDEIRGLKVYASLSAIDRPVDMVEVFRRSEDLMEVTKEAIAINAERITPTTAVIDVGPSILVNAAYLAGPYQVSAIGPDDLYARLSASPGFVDLIRTRAQGFGIGVSIAEPEAVDIPAFAGTVTLRYARPEPSPGASP